MPPADGFVPAAVPPPPLESLSSASSASSASPLSTPTIATPSAPSAPLAPSAAASASTSTAAITPSGGTPPMSAATKELLARVRRIVPPMLSHFHKGQLGRVGVIGGSADYTGAPYFSAMASARLGCDMSHVICTPEAAAVIKTYSPNLMVHPLMRSGNSISGDIEMGAENVSRPIIDMLSRLHVLVVGPGLGRDPLMLATAANVIKAARKRSMPVVIDADALRIVNERPWLLREYKQAVLTPNVVEFGRLEKAIVKNVDQSEGTAGRLVDVAKELKGVTVVQKGAVDCIGSFPWRGPEYGPIVCDLPGGRKRSGGQGDTLTGAIATFLAWGQAYRDNLWTSKNEVGRLDDDELVMLAAFGGCAITRECSRLAFAKHGRSLQASDLTGEVHTAFKNLFGADEDEYDEEMEGSWQTVKKNEVADEAKAAPHAETHVRVPSSQP